MKMLGPQMLLPATWITVALWMQGAFGGGVAGEETGSTLGVVLSDVLVCVLICAHTMLLFEMRRGK